VAEEEIRIGCGTTVFDIWNGMGSGEEFHKSLNPSEFTLAEVAHAGSFHVGIIPHFMDEGADFVVAFG
jgi:hypothetical protein